MTTKEVYNDTEGKMKKALEVLQKEFGSLRAGRATPALLEKITVDYYGTPTPIHQIANLSVPESRLLVIQPWEKKIINDIEKAILKSDLGLTPANDGNVIRLTIPQLTRERRVELVKVIGKKAEEARVAIRNLRRDANELLKKMEKDKKISEDEGKRAQEDIQKLTDKYIKEVDHALHLKEKEIMEI